jgi:hypothetical protein
MTAYLPNKGYKTRIPDILSTGKRECIITYSLNINSETLNITEASKGCKAKRVVIDSASSFYGSNRIIPGNTFVQY